MAQRFFHKTSPASKRTGFTLVELITVIAIGAILVTTSVLYIGSYITDAKKVSDGQTLAVLNEALTRYKCQGGDLNALTLGAPVGNILSKLQADTTWNGVTHSFLQKGKTYPARSLTSNGTGKGYHFCRFNNYDGYAEGTLSPPTSYPAGVGYASNMKVRAYNALFGFAGGAGAVAVKDASGNITRLGSGVYYTGTSNYITFWACTSTNDSTPKGYISSAYFRRNQLKSVNLKSLTNIQTVDISGAGNPYHECTALDLSDITTLTTLDCGYGTLKTLNVSGCTNLVTVTCYYNNLTTLNVSNCPVLVTLTASGNPPLASLDVSTCTSLVTLKLADTTITATSLALNTFCGTLPVFTEGTHTLYAGWNNWTDWLTTASGRGWTGAASW